MSGRRPAPAHGDLRFPRQTGIAGKPPERSRIDGLGRPQPRKFSSAGPPKLVDSPIQNPLQSMPTSMNSADRGRYDRGRRPRIGRRSPNPAGMTSRARRFPPFPLPSPRCRRRPTAPTEGGTTQGASRHPSPPIIHHKPSESPNPGDTPSRTSLPIYESFR